MEYRKFPAITDLFDLHTNGLKTNRDDVVNDWDRDKLSQRIRNFIKLYNAEVHRHRADINADWPDRIKWSETLELNVERGTLIGFEDGEIIRCLYRPFTRRSLFFDRVLNERVYQWPKISGPVVCVTDIWIGEAFYGLSVRGNRGPPLGGRGGKLSVASPSPT